MHAQTVSPLRRWGVQGLEPASPILMPGHAEPTIYDVGRWSDPYIGR